MYGDDSLGSPEPACRPYRPADVGQHGCCVLQQSQAPQVHAAEGQAAA